MGRLVALFVAVCLCLALVPGVTLARDRFSPGAPGIGDPYFPLDGNGGYDVQHYLLDVRYHPETDFLRGVATIKARATQNLSAFNLDFDGLTVRSVRVDGHNASWSRSDGELTVRPRDGIRNRQRFTIVVRYDGVPEPIEDQFGLSGFIHTDDGALIVGQPHVAATWFPANDHPIDKASFTFTIAVPAGLEAVANGRLESRQTRRGWTTWIWDAPDPMATYLAGVGIGEFDLRAYKVDGIRYWDAFDPDLFLPPPPPPEFIPRTGSQFAYSQMTNDGAEGPAPSWKRLSRTIDVPVGGATLSFWALRDTEPGFDFLFVESRTAGAEDWTTLDASPFTSQDPGACPIFGNPFLEHYLTLVLVDEGDPGTPEDDIYECQPNGSSGEWHAASGTSSDWEQWSVQLADADGGARQVEVSISFASDESVQLRGVVVDDIVVSPGQGTTSFEADGDVMDGWTAAPPPPESVAPNNWIVATAADLPPAPPPPPTFGEVAEASLDRQPEIIDFLEGYYGEYPFRIAGGIVDDADFFFALETQTRPIYSKYFFFNEESGANVVVHELAHMWFGDSLAIERWSDIWLNEGFATYAEWLWAEHEGYATPQDIFDGLASIPAGEEIWHVAPADPGPDNLFGFSSYQRGAMTLHALRLEVGDRDFFRILRRWFQSQRGGNVTTAEFFRLAERVSGEQLDELFDVWLYTPAKPAGLPEPPPEPEALRRATDPSPAIRGWHDKERTLRR